MKRKEWMKILLPVAVVLVCILGAVQLIRSRPALETEPSETPPPLVRVMTVQPETLQLKVYSQGNVVPRTESTLASEVAGQVVYVSPAFAAGGFFEEGDVLVRLDPRDAELAVTRAKAEVARAEMALTIEEEEARVARQEWAQMGQGAPSPLVVREPQLAQARANLSAAKAMRKQAELDLARTEIRAPFAGRVRIKHVDVGQYVTPGAPIARIYAIDYAEVRLPIPDDQLAYMDAPIRFRGDQANIQGPEVVLESRFAGQQYRWTGRIVRLEGEIDPQSRMVHAVARVQNPYGRGQNPDRPPLSVGLFVNAAIKGHTLENVIVIPRAAIRGSDQVLVVDDEERLRFRDLDILRMEPDRAIVRDGLQPGERICLSPLDVVVEGMPVRVLKEEQPGPSIIDKKGAAQ